MNSMSTRRRLRPRHRLRPPGPWRSSPRRCASSASATTAPSVPSVPDNPDNGVTSDTITIGWMGDLTGPTASAQSYNAHGLEAYVECLNADGGVLGRQVEVVFEDDQYAAEAASVNYTKLVQDDKVLTIVNMGGSHISTQLAPQVESDGDRRVRPAPDDRRPAPGHPLLQQPRPLRRRGRRGVGADRRRDRQTRGRRRRRDQPRGAVRPGVGGVHAADGGERRRHLRRHRLHRPHRHRGGRPGHPAASSGSTTRG